MNPYKGLLDPVFPVIISLLLPVKEKPEAFVMPLSAVLFDIALLFVPAKEKPVLVKLVIFTVEMVLKFPPDSVIPFVTWFTIVFDMLRYFTESAFTPILNPEISQFISDTLFTPLMENALPFNPPSIIFPLQSSLTLLEVIVMQEPPELESSPVLRE